MTKQTESTVINLLGTQKTDLVVPLDDQSEQFSLQMAEAKMSAAQRRLTSPVQQTNQNKDIYGILKSENLTSVSTEPKKKETDDDQKRKL